MAERGFSTGFWTDPFIQNLSVEGKLLFAYLWTSPHCNQAGFYQITLKTMAFDTGITEPELSEFLPKLAPKAIWYPEHNLIWVKNFVRWQTKSPKFLVAVIKAFNSIRAPEEIKAEYETYNEELLRGVAPSEHVSPTKRECVLIRDNFHCQYCDKEIANVDDYEMDHIIPISRGGKENYLNLVAACRNCNQKKLDKTPQEVGFNMPTPTPFHGAQATYILKNDRDIREKWLKVFPDRYKVIESILFNIKQYCGSLPSSASADLDTKADSLSDKGKGVVKGEGGITANEIQEIATLYTEEIGKITPVVGAALNDAVKEYPADWIKDAIKIAVHQNKRKWRYIEAILERWKNEGRGGKREDASKYEKQKYAHRFSK